MFDSDVEPLLKGNTLVVFESSFHSAGYRNDMVDSGAASYTQHEGGVMRQKWN